MLKWQVRLANGLNIPKMNPQKWHVRSASGLNIPQSMQMAQALGYDLRVSIFYVLKSCQNGKLA